jgi:hypothetical protein
MRAENSFSFFSSWPEKATRLHIFRPRLADVVDSPVYRSCKSLIKSAFMLLVPPPCRPFTEIILFINFSVALLTFDALRCLSQTVDDSFELPFSMKHSCHSGLGCENSARSIFIYLLISFCSSGSFRLLFFRFRSNPRWVY